MEQVPDGMDDGKEEEKIDRLGEGRDEGEERRGRKPHLDIDIDTSKITKYVDNLVLALSKNLPKKREIVVRLEGAWEELEDIWKVRVRTRETSGLFAATRKKTFPDQSPG
ncbi:hypothetical protein RUM43_013939 [Polyplax serrata]|uniref:Uncharacterized protein n=1 Tax=Polyplax serrata TaxID=468196 RepID=A0AAN8RY75_POLSC